MATFVDGGGPRFGGIVGAFVEDNPTGVQLSATWVGPAVRRGIGRRLAEAVASWARDVGAPRVRLWVTESNRAASALHSQCGFVPTAETELPSYPSLIERLMVREH